MVKKSVTVKYEAFDGKTFDSEEACQRYEDENFAKQFTNLKLPQVQALLKPLSEQTDAEKRLAASFELFGGRIARNRLAAGDRKRQRRAADAAPATSQTVQGSSDDE